MTPKQLERVITNIIANPTRWEDYFGANVTRMLKVDSVRRFAHDTMAQIVQVLYSEELLRLDEDSKKG